MKLPGSVQISRAHILGAAAMVLAVTLGHAFPEAAVISLVAFVLTSVTAALFPTWSYYLHTHSHGLREGRGVALTFDDGPDPAVTMPLLDLLAREGVRATFFVVGERAQAHPAEIDRILSDGHTIGNHSWSHDPWLMFRSSARLEKDIRACQQVLARHGVEPLAFRPPVGVTNPRLPSVLRRLGLRCVTFRIRPRDLYNTRLNGLAERILARARTGDFILLHDFDPGPSGRASWLAEVQQLIAGLRARRFAIVPIEELLGCPVMQRIPPAVGTAPEIVFAEPRGGSLLGKLTGALTAFLFVGYPVLTYAGLKLLGARGGALVLLSLFLLSHLRRQKPRPAALRGLAWMAAAVGSLLVLGACLDDPRFLLVYPAMVNFVLLVNFAGSLRGSTSMVERFARLEVECLSAAEARYCRSVTVVWCCFFIANGSASAILAAFGTREGWALYTGLVAYVLMGLLFGTEYVVRKTKFGRFGNGLLDRLLRHLLNPGLSP